ncbi:MAG: OB-fold nucleic acid binding domain-containing protein, partial [bacterium]
MAEIGSLKDCIGEIVTVLGWIDAIRSHGKIGFLVVRDGTGLAQGVILKEEVSQDLWDSHQSMALECSVALTWELREEPRASG